MCVLRLGAIYGPGRELGRRFQALAGTTRPGDGQTHSNWIHRDDVAGAWDETVNVVDDQPWRVADLLDRISNRRLHSLGYALLHPTLGGL